MTLHQPPATAYNPTSGLTVAAHVCQGCSGPFAPEYTDIPHSAIFCRTCRGDGTLYQILTGKRHPWH